MSDLLPLLDELDRLHGAAGAGDWCYYRRGFITDGSAWAGWVLRRDDDVAAEIDDDRIVCEADPEDAELVAALHNAYPRLSAALRAVLTPVMEGEREAREALAAHDERMKDQWSWKRAENPDVEIHLRTALSLLTAEHAKAADIDDRHQSQIADYQQEVARLRAALDAERAKGRA